MNAHSEHLDSRWKDWVEQHENEDTSALALRYSGKPGLPLRFLLQQVKGRQVARQKLPAWYGCSDILYPDTISLEQCSSEATALYKSQFVQGKVVADLTGGLGIDTWAFAGTARSVLYNEPDEERVIAARHNLSALGRTNVVIQQGSAGEALERGLPTGCDIVYLDPSRRADGGRKVILLQDLQPEVLSLKKRILDHVDRLLIKLSPMFDLQEGLRMLPETTRVDILSWRGECRELLFHLGSENGNPNRDRCVVCSELESFFPDFEFRPEDAIASPSSIAEKPATWLYEPHAAIRKAGAWSLLCKRFGMEALHPNTHLFTSERCAPEFPGRRFRILEILPYRTDELLEHLAGRPARMVFYNFPVKAEQVIAQLRIPSGEPLWLFFVTLAQGQTAVLMTEREV